MTTTLPEERRGQDREQVSSREGGRGGGVWASRTRGRSTEAPGTGDTANVLSHVAPKAVSLLLGGQNSAFQISGTLQLVTGGRWPRNQRLCRLFVPDIPPVTDCPMGRTQTAGKGAKAGSPQPRTLHRPEHPAGQKGSLRLPL